MEHEFDKEIDAMLRNARRDGPVLIGDATSPHLDADQIAAFAENALPAKTRALQMAHMADCDRCRKILSNLLVMNAEAAPAAATPGVITIAERSIPWYKSLFMFPNIAYVMGGLVLVFGAFLAFTIIQRSSVSDSAKVAVAPLEPAARNRAGADAETASAAANTMANAAANVSSNPAVSSANANAASVPNTGASGPSDRENSYILDGVDTSTMPAQAQPPAAPPPVVGRQPAASKDAATLRDDALAKPKPAEDKVAAEVVAPAQEPPAKSDTMKQQQGYSNNAQTQSGPMRNNERQYNQQLENMDRRAAAVKKERDEEASSGRRVVGGRTFERKQNVWYDKKYQSHPTINVRRGSDEFKRLDAGLRSIADQLSGTIVVVWGAKAYRIQ